MLNFDEPKNLNDSGQGNQSLKRWRHQNKQGCPYSGALLSTVIFPSSVFLSQVLLWSEEMNLCDFQQLLKGRDGR